MSVEFTEEERLEAVEFLQKFASEHSRPIGEEDPLPVRVATLSVARDEVEGECIDWALEYLRRSEAPSALKAIITRQVVNEVLGTDLSVCENSQEDDDDDDVGKSQLDASKLARVVFSKVHEVCKHWSQDHPVFYKSSMHYDVCVQAIKNTRRKMEDRHVIVPDFNTLLGFPQDFPSQAFFAVYDGHGGADAAVYASTHLHCLLAKNKDFRQGAEEGAPAALAEAFWKTDESFGVKAKREGLRCGSTGVSALIHGDKLYIAWLGDSQAILSKGGQLFSLMEPHKPERQDEKERIESLGGCVVWFGAWRVNGSLSVSRAIGDVEHKPYICGDPDVIEYEFDGDEDFLILACDGLWDVLKLDDAVTLVHNLIADGVDRTCIAKELVTYATDNGSSDNISVVVVFLDAHKKDTLVIESAVADVPIINDISLPDGVESLEGNGHANGENVAATICSCDEDETPKEVNVNSLPESIEQMSLDGDNLEKDSSTRKQSQQRSSRTPPNKLPDNLPKTSFNKGNLPCDTKKVSRKTKGGQPKTRENQSGSVKTKKVSSSPNNLAVKGRVARSKSAPNAFRVT